MDVTVLITSTLVVDTLLFSTDALTICNEDDVLFGGDYYNNSGVYYDTLQAIAGCGKSTAEHLNVKPLKMHQTHCY